MRNNAFRQNNYYVDSLSRNTEIVLRKKVRSCEHPNFVPVGHTDNSRTKIIIVGIAFFSIIIFFLPLNLPARGSYMKSISSGEQASLFAGQTGLGLPVRLKIPAIHVDAAIEQVAETADGSMDVPKDLFNTAWYKLGPRPGEKGSAVIDGHVDGKNGGRAVFSDLHNLKLGDKITVEDDQGAVISFVVRELRTFDPKADASDVFVSNDGRAHLNFITCFGVWDKVANNYSQRLVVFADKEI